MASLEPGVQVGSVERAGARSARSRTAASRTASSGVRREYSAHRLGRQLAELLVGHLAARDPDEVEALGQRAVVREVVERGQQLAVGQVARRAEDREVRRVDGQPLEALGERVVVETSGGVDGTVVLTAASGCGRRARACRRPRRRRSSVTRSARQVVRAERVEVADRLGVLEAGEAVVRRPGSRRPARSRGRAAGSARSAGRPCGAGRSSAGSAGRSRTSSPTASRRGSRRAAPSRRRRRPRDGCDVAHHREVVRRRRGRSSSARSASSSASGWSPGPSSRTRVGRVLGLLHVGLVERVDAEHPAGDRDRELGEEEQPPEVGRAVDRRG